MSLLAATQRRISRIFRPRRTPGSLVFLHIPKTGGTSVVKALSAHYRPDQCFTDNGNISVSLLVKHAEDIARGCFVHGHCERATLPHMAGARLITVLRRPEDHAISHYLYLRRETGQTLHVAATTHDFSSFYRINWQMMAFQAISLDVAQSAAPVDSPESFFSRVPAIRAFLDRLDFVGCLDDLDNFLPVIATLADAGRRLPRLNAAPKAAASQAQIDNMRAQYQALSKAPDTGPVLAVEQDLYERAKLRCTADIRKSGT